MNADPALLMAVKAVDEIKTTLLRHSYAVMTIDDAGLRNAITPTATEARSWFSGTSDAGKRAIQQVRRHERHRQRRRPPPAQAWVHVRALLR